MKLAEQIKEVGKMKLPLARGFDKIAVCGMGGSGIAGHVLRDLIDDVPVFVFQSYILPEFIDKKTLVFCISHSGNTAETISMHRIAKKRGCKTAVIASGGILGREKNCILIPSGMQPRQAIGYLFFPMWKMLGKSFGDTAKIVSEVKNDLGIAKKIYGKIPVVYSNEGYGSLVLRWKQQLNEDSKVLAIANTFPELNHNEIEARFENAQIIFLRDKPELAIDVLKKEYNILDVYLKGKNKLEKIFYGMALVNFVSINLAGLNGEDYLKYRFIEKLKEEMRNKK